MKASHFIQPWKNRKLIQWKQNSKHSNYMTQGIDPISMYSVMCSGFKYNFGSLGGKWYQNAWQTVCWSTHTNWCGCQPNRILMCIHNILKLFVPLSQRNESCKVMNQLFKVCTLCRHSHTNDRIFARSGILWHSFMFQLMELLYSFLDINKWIACSCII